MSAAAWLKAFVGQFGPVPDDYLVIDTETTGLDRSDDLIIQLGYCRVTGREVMVNEACTLDWTGYPALDKDWLRARLDATRRNMQARGTNYSWTYESPAQGRPPLEVLSELFLTLQQACADGLAVVAHNGYGFDLPMIGSHFKRYLFLDWKPCPGLWDTGLMEKALQLDLRPRPGESLADFSRRVLGTRASVKWSLERHVVPKYGLAVKYGLGLERCHSADFDALLAGLLLEEYRDLGGPAIPEVLMRIAGIDPGLKGGLAVLDTCTGRMLGYPFPLMGPLKATKARGDNREPDIEAMLQLLGEVDLVILEQVWTRPVRHPRKHGEGREYGEGREGAGRPQGGASNAKLVGFFREVRGALKAAGLFYDEVAPRSWQNVVLAGTAKDKAASVAHVLAHYPTVVLRPGRKRTDQDGIADAACLAAYGYRLVTDPPPHCQRRHPAVIARFRELLHDCPPTRLHG